MYTYITRPVNQLFIPGAKTDAKYEDSIHITDAYCTRPFL